MTAGAFNKVISFVEWKNDTAGGKLKIEKMSGGGYRFPDANEPSLFVYIDDEPEGVFKKLWDAVEALA